MTQWKPMDGAPKDKAILLQISGKAIQGAWDARGGWWDDEKGEYPGDWNVVSMHSHGCGCCSSSNPEPTGWMELPS